MRNAVTRRPHKERSQPQSREKWGILEKHKDYSLRAQDYNNKKKKLAQLSRKAKERNPDEFAFGMLSQGKAGLGKHKTSAKANSDSGVPLSHDAVKLLKTQDAGYLRTLAARGRHEIEKLNQEVGIDSVTLGSGVGRHTQFSDAEATTRGKKRAADGELLDDSIRNSATNVLLEANGITSSLHDPDRDDPETAAGITPSKPKSKTLAAENSALVRLRAERKKRKRLQEMRVTKLEALKKRQREILAAADQLELQRAKMARTVGGVNKDGVKFKIRERKK